jgi:hypothetical protein
MHPRGLGLIEPREPRRSRLLWAQSAIWASFVGIVLLFPLESVRVPVLLTVKFPGLSIVIVCVFANMALCGALLGLGAVTGGASYAARAVAYQSRMLVSGGQWDAIYLSVSSKGNGSTVGNGSGGRPSLMSAL